MEFKKLVALLLCALTVARVTLAEETAAKEAIANNGEVKNLEGKSRKSRYNRNRKSAAKDNSQWTGPVTDTVVSGGYERRHGHYHGGSCSTGSCGVKKSSCHSHACKDRDCGQCRKGAIPPRPCCEKAVTVRTEPCLHKQVQYSWTCPVDYTETNCPTC